MSAPPMEGSVRFDGTSSCPIGPRRMSHWRSSGGIAASFRMNAGLMVGGVGAGMLARVTVEAGEAIAAAVADGDGTDATVAVGVGSGGIGGRVDTAVGGVGVAVDVVLGGGRRR